MPPPHDQSDGACAAKVTSLLNGAGAGDPRAAADLLPLVYEQLRALAARKMRQERPDQTLQATALVHEAYLRVVDAAKVQPWDNRWHFFAAAAEAMRRILLDNARGRGRLKRGGGLQRIDLDCVGLGTIAFSPDARTVASGGENRIITIWERATGEVRSSLVGHGHYVAAVAFSPDGKTLASARLDRTVKLWDLTARERGTIWAGTRRKSAP